MFSLLLMCDIANSCQARIAVRGTYLQETPLTCICPHLTSCRYPEEWRWWFRMLSERVRWGAHGMNERTLPLLSNLSSAGPFRRCGLLVFSAARDHVTCRKGRTFDRFDGGERLALSTASGLRDWPGCCEGKERGGTGLGCKMRAKP